MLGGEVAVPCHPQSALAGLNARPRVAAFGVSTSRAALTARSRAMRAREPGQIRKEAALSGSGHVPRIGLARASHDASARGPLSRTGRTVLPDSGVERGRVDRVAGPPAPAWPPPVRHRGGEPAGDPAGPSRRIGRGAARQPASAGGRCGAAARRARRAPARVDDPGRMPGLGRRVHPGEVEVVAAAMAGVAVPADPAPGRDRLVLPRLGEVGEVADLAPGAAHGPVGDDVGREADRVLAVPRRGRGRSSSRR